MGNAPTAETNVFEDAENATVYYLSGTSGWGSTFGGLPAIMLSGLALNGGFERGDFTGWTLSGDTSYTSVDGGSKSGLRPYSGNYDAVLGTSGSRGYCSQTLARTAGARYEISLWLDSPDGQTPNEFLLSWNANTLFDETNIPAIGWTNLQFLVLATGSSTVLQFGFRDDFSYLALDDISVAPAEPAIASLRLSGGSLVLNAIGGRPGATYYVLASPTPGLPLGLWTPVATNVLTASENFSITLTNAVSPILRQRFYILELQ
jgi:hypothetical protein